LRLTVAIGTRPEVIKLAPVVKALAAAGHEMRVIATGQHADPKLASELFAELDCPPGQTWALPDGEAARVGSLLTNAFAELSARRPDAVLVLGDTYTAPLVAMAARRVAVGVVHVEAGLRSFNETSMEELNRRMLAALATVHLAPTGLAAGFLRREGVADERVRVVGNPIIDSLVASGVRPRPVSARAGALVTAHRANNVDDPARLAQLVSLLDFLARSYGPVRFPMHPRTRARLDEAGLLGRVRGLPGVQVSEPLGYRDLLEVLAGSRVVVTDSGGLQEEASFFGVPSVVLRTTTPRWEGVVAGAAELTGMDAARAAAAVNRLTGDAERIAGLDCPYGDGRTSQRVVAALADPRLLCLLRPTEPPVSAGLPPAVAAELLVAR
jgi:UDP-N-acetylglucosamine 2-epimerase (non-hydrolysing)